MPLCRVFSVKKEPQLVFLSVTVEFERQNTGAVLRLKRWSLFTPVIGVVAECNAARQPVEKKYEELNCLLVKSSVQVMFTGN